MAGTLKGMIPAENRSSHGGILVSADPKKVIRLALPDKPQDLGSTPDLPTPSGFRKSLVVPVLPWAFTGCLQDRIGENQAPSELTSRWVDQHRYGIDPRPDPPCQDHFGSRLNAKSFRAMCKLPTVRKLAH